MVFEFFFAFSKSAWNLEYFEKKDESQRLFVSKSKHCKKRGYLNAEKARIRTLMDSVHDKRPETKHCINLHSTIFVLFFDHSGRKLDPKILFQ